MRISDRSSDVCSSDLITAACLKLFPRPAETEVAFVAVRDPAAAVELLARARAATGDRVNAFELIPHIGLHFALKHVPGIEDPLAGRRGWYVLVDLASSRAAASLPDRSGERRVGKK